ncbi:MAG: Nif3-like dinuclear metal center hexameric protein [bacterium]|nr:Nif3-like dinuclear metal center hexameric protein [bacterium]MDT8395117.1 Nif3-like dinuclear metal center hexameric protein [bacterium]
MKAPTVGQIVTLIEEIIPLSIGMAGDPLGLQCGDPAAQVKKIMYALDAGLEVVHQAVGKGVDLLVSHHPMIFEPLDHRAITGTKGKPLVTAVKGSLSVYSVHTNLDASPVGINVELARLAGLQDTKVLSGTGSDGFKVVAFVPAGSLEKVRDAAFHAGAGHIGSYSHCSFATRGVGTFFGEDASGPARGEAGRFEEADEFRLELIVKGDVLATVLKSIRRTHPYEEPALDAYPLESAESSTGMGLVGTLEGKTSVGEIASRLKSALKVDTARLVGTRGRKVKTVAVCAGSGSSLLGAAVSAGAQLFITGDMKYHDARSARDMGITVLDMGHFAPERYGLRRFASLLDSRIAQSGWRIDSTFARESDPFVSLS